ncbi:MAG: epoxide hydrolase family protein [Gemmatimonadaceae bacterium]
MEPFAIDTPLADVEELRKRLRRTRWPSGIRDSGGFALSDAQSLVRYWSDTFDWAAQCARLNQYPQYILTVGDLPVHFIHSKSGNRGALPLLLLHGWPGSFIEFLGVIDRLRDKFDLVVPSLPGFDFSHAPSSPGMSNLQMADVLASLMTTLGYQQFGVHGGDIGAGVATWMARRHSNRMVGLHLNYLPGSYTPSQTSGQSHEEMEFLTRVSDWYGKNGAYGHLQSTRPLTLAYGLSDSPAGLATWIAEKFGEWSDPATPISRDIVLANVTIYWLTNSISSSMRVYLESSATPLKLEPGEMITVPTAFARFPFEISRPPRSWVERGYNLVRWTDMPRGGHFAALEAPELLAEDIEAFF